MQMHPKAFCRVRTYDDWVWNGVADARARRRAAAERTPRDAYAAAVEAVREERGDAGWVPEVRKRVVIDGVDAVVARDD